MYNVDTRTSFPRANVQRGQAGRFPCRLGSRRFLHITVCNVRCGVGLKRHRPVNYSRESNEYIFNTRFARASVSFFFFYSFKIHENHFVSYNLFNIDTITMSTNRTYCKKIVCQMFSPILSNDAAELIIIIIIIEKHLFLSGTTNSLLFYQKSFKVG